MRIAVFDYETTPSNPYGQGVLRVLDRLCDEHDFTVYSLTMRNPRPDRIRWVRVPAVRRPLIALYLSFHVMAPLVFGLDRLRYRQRFDLRQSLESALVRADVVGAQFCHRAYLREHWPSSRPSGWRRPLRWAYERAAAALEPRALGDARLVVVPSSGIQRELNAEYADLGDRVVIVPNAVAHQDALPPEDFDRAAARARIGIPAEAVAFVFVALGHYERKGLPLVLDALAQLAEEAHVVVVGGSSDLVERYRSRAARQGLGARAHFVGAQADVRPFLWTADAFVLPSAYETFSYATYEAAAAGLPVIVSALHGVEEFLVPGRNGLLVAREPDAVAQAMQQLIDAGPEGRRAMGRAAREDVRRFGIDEYVDGWSEVYKAAARRGEGDDVAPRPTADLV